MMPAALGQWWQQRNPREQAVLRAAVAVLLASAAWAWWLQPTWRSLATLPAQISAAQQTAGTVSALAQQAQALQASAPALPLGRTQAVAAVQALSEQWLGPDSRVVVNPASLQVVLAQVPPTQLAQWLQAVRQQARLQAHTGQLQRDAASGLWQGELVLSGPPLQRP